jgi:tetratricopeptide (TPR) repeat protein
VQLADTFHGLAIVLAELKKPAEAESAFDQSVTLRKRLAADFPNVLAYRCELGKTYSDLGNLLIAIGRPKDAEFAWREALPLRKQLAADSKAPDYHNDLAGTLGRLATLHYERREFAAAAALLEEARPHHQAALEAHAKNPLYRQFYHGMLVVLARSQLELPDHARLAATAEELARSGFDPPNDASNAARCLCRCAALAGKDAQLDESRSKELAQSYADRAMALLRQAVARGYKNAARLKQDPHFGVLREREEFKQLLAELEGKNQQ